MNTFLGEPDSSDTESDSIENNHVIDLSEEMENELVLDHEDEPEPVEENHANERPPTTPAFNNQATREHNRSLKHNVVKEVRKPGKSEYYYFYNNTSIQGNR